MRRPCENYAKNWKLEITWSLLPLTIIMMIVKNSTKFTKKKKFDSKSEFLQNIKNTNNIWAELFLKLRSESKKPQTKI